MKASDVYFSGIAPVADHKQLAVYLRKYDRDGYYSFYSGCDWPIKDKEVYKILFENIKAKDVTGEFIYYAYKRWSNWKPAPSIIERLLKRMSAQKYLQMFQNDKHD